MRTVPLCTLDKVIVMPSTAKLNLLCETFQTKSEFFEELLFAFEDEDLTELLLDFAEDEEVFAVDEEVTVVEEELFTSLRELDDSVSCPE